MNLDRRIELAVAGALASVDLKGTPPRLIEAMNYAVFPGGHRVRPRLCLAVAMACGDDHPGVSDCAAAAAELLHCASLVHDDLPCFDGAAMRRGKPSVHAAFGEDLALLTGDALIVRAFQVLAQGAATAPERLADQLIILSNGVGTPNGIVAGQAWECEGEAPLREYQRAKTGALFAAATMLGAAAAGADPSPWRQLGDTIGEAYQVADDLLDANAEAQAIGKPVGNDVALNRPSSVRTMGQHGAARYLESLVEQAADCVPPCAGEEPLRALIVSESRQFMELALSCRAAA